MATALLRRLASSSLLALGIVFIFVGISSALGFSVVGLIASVVTIAGLLYAGGVWFGATPVPQGVDGAGVIVFDRELLIVAGPATGVSVLSQFPEAQREEIEARCRAALRGGHEQFVCELAGRRRAFDVVPVQTKGGAAAYGVLIAGEPSPDAAAGAKAQMLSGQGPMQK